MRNDYELARPVNLVGYTPETPIHELAAGYGFGFAKSHVFNDGNKRISLTVIDVFLQLNGMQLLAEEVEAVCVIKDLASSEMDETALAAWIRHNTDFPDSKGYDDPLLLVQRDATACVTGG